jgi:hypothetical protein
MQVSKGYSPTFEQRGRGRSRHRPKAREQRTHSLFSGEGTGEKAERKPSTTSTHELMNTEEGRLRSLKECE